MLVIFTVSAEAAPASDVAKAIAAQFSTFMHILPIFLSAADDPPLLHAMLYEFDEKIKCNGKECDDDQYRKDAGGIEWRAGKLHEIAKPAIGRDHLAQHGTDQRIGHRDLQTGKDPGHRRRDDNLGDHLRSRSLHQPGSIDQVLIDLAYARVSVEKHKEQHEHGGKRHLRFNAESEPQH